MFVWGTMRLDCGGYVDLTWDFLTLSWTEIKAMQLGGIPQSVVWLCTLVGIGFNALNFYWMNKIIRKALFTVKQWKTKST